MSKVIFVHGSGASSRIWRYQRDTFPQADFISLPGHPRGKPHPSVEGYVSWLHNYIRRKGYSGVVLAGHSLGGAIILLYALKYPSRLTGLILVATGARLRVHPMYTGMMEEAIKGNNEGWNKWLQEQYTRVSDPRFREELIKMHLKVGPAVQLNDFLCCHNFDIMNRLGEIKVPTLVLVGSEDILTPVRYADYLASHIPGAQKAILPHSTHNLFLEKPNQFNQHIADFLNKLPY